MTSDWKEVYRQELKRPGYVIEDGRLPRGRQQQASIKPAMTTLRQAKRKAV